MRLIELEVPFPLGKSAGFPWPPDVPSSLPLYNNVFTFSGAYDEEHWYIDHTNLMLHPTRVPPFMVRQMFDFLPPNGTTITSIVALPTAYRNPCTSMKFEYHLVWLLVLSHLTKEEVKPH